jgi:Trypsin-co-occurring domain 1
MSAAIPLIVLTAPAVDVPVDRGGGEPQGFIKRAVEEVTRAVPYEQFAARLEDIIDKVQAVAHRLKAEVADFVPEEITIGLAVSGEGDIGVATAGVEASIKITFKRHAHPNAIGGAAPRSTKAADPAPVDEA